MNHLGTVTMETERLLLRPFVWEDREAMFRNWESDREVTRYLRWQHYESLEDVGTVLREWIDSYQQPDFYQWAIVPRDLGDPIGTISVVEQDDRVGKAAIGYCIGRPWWRQGYTSEALSRIIDFLIAGVGVNRVESWHDPNNPNSGAVMRKCGMTYEATLRQADWNNQGVCDICMYAILAQEWRERNTRCQPGLELPRGEDNCRSTLH